MVEMVGVGPCGKSTLRASVRLGTKSSDFSLEGLAFQPLLYNSSGEMRPRIEVVLAHSLNYKHYVRYGYMSKPIKVGLVVRREQAYFFRLYISPY